MRLEPRDPLLPEGLPQPLPVFFFSGIGCANVLLEPLATESFRISSQSGLQDTPKLCQDQPVSLGGDSLGVTVTVLENIGPYDAS